MQPPLLPPDLASCPSGRQAGLTALCRFLACLLGLWAFMPPAQADIVVVVGHHSPIVSLSKAQVADLYLGRSRTLPNGDLAQVFDHPHRDPLRERFFLLLTGLSLQPIDAYWARLTFSGRVLPPRSLPDEEALLDVVRKNVKAIGYIRHGPLPDTVRAVLVLKE